MKVESKFDLHSIGFYMKNNRVAQLLITNIKTSTIMFPSSDGYGIKTSTSVIYSDADGNTVPENELFASKQELLDTL